MNTKQQQFTRAELDVIFHVLNNSFGDSWEMAIERAKIVDNWTREEFVKVYSKLIPALIASGS